MELTYTKVGDYYIPDLTAEPLPSRDLGKYGRMRLRYLQDHKSELYAALLMEGRLFDHLLDIEGHRQWLAGPDDAGHGENGRSYRGIEKP